MSSRSQCRRKVLSNYYKYVVVPIRRARPRQLKKELEGTLRRVADRRGVRDAAAPPAGVRNGVADGALPVAEDVCARHICLPVHSDMTEDEVDHVLMALREVGDELAGIG